MDMEERIRGIYNDCWKIYKEYLRDHDMGKYNQNAEELIKKYGCEEDVKDLIFWFASRITFFRDQYLKEGGKL